LSIRWTKWTRRPCGNKRRSPLLAWKNDLLISFQSLPIYSMKQLDCFLDLAVVAWSDDAFVER
jgi:hypothetical protein